MYITRIKLTSQKVHFNTQNTQNVATGASKCRERIISKMFKNFAIYLLLYFLHDSIYNQSRN